MGIETSLRDAIVKGFDELNRMEVGSDEHKATVDELTKLLDRAIEMDKIDLEHEEKIEAFEYEKDLKERQFKSDKIDRIVKHSLTFLGITAPLGLAVWGTFVSFRFEETGKFVSTHVGRGFINMLLPKK